MTFRRSNNGISNQHLFLSVDAIIFVEGGPSFSKSEVYENKYTSYSLDIKFWNKIFSYYCPSKSFHLRAIGCKKTLYSIAEDLEAGVIENCYVATDRDHDDYVSKLRQTKYTKHTFGYSWENDVWQEKVILDVFFSLCFLSDIFPQIKSTVSDIISEFKSKIALCVCADRILAKKEESFFPRPNCLRLITLRKNGTPIANELEIKKLIKDKKIDCSEIQKECDRGDISTIRDCFGHFWGSFCYRIVSFLIKKYSSQPNIAQSYVSAIAIDKFFENLESHRFSDIHSHYKSILQNC